MRIRLKPRAAVSTSRRRRLGIAIGLLVSMTAVAVVVTAPADLELALGGSFLHRNPPLLHRGKPLELLLLWQHAEAPWPGRSGGFSDEPADPPEWTDELQIELIAQHELDTGEPREAVVLRRDAFRLISTGPDDNPALRVPLRANILGDPGSPVRDGTNKGLR